MSLAGKTLYHLWHRPVGALCSLIAEGGPVGRHRTETGRKGMIEAASLLPPLPNSTSNAEPIPLYLLTGNRYWYQSAFCLWSLAVHSGRTLNPFIYDDGTLLESQRETVQRLFPYTTFLSVTSTIEKLDDLLPESRFPFLRDRWLRYPNIRKLIDPHLGSTGWKMVIDSDLLFFREPSVLLEWLDNPRVPFHAVDCTTSYGYSRPLLNELAGASLAERVNVGLCGLNSSELDWEQLEFWCRQLITQEGTSYYLEQALVAMLVAGRACRIATEEDYITLPRQPEASACRAVMHHYVAESKCWYFRNNWKLLLSQTGKSLS